LSVVVDVYFVVEKIFQKGQFFVHVIVIVVAGDIIAETIVAMHG
jgi:hypothetical protein